tara:strand:+ start:2153 stop:3028 length:876 start_codon:yes stop_codon:yes gene_type:complete
VKYLKIVVTFFCIFSVSSPGVSDPIFGSSKLLATAGVVQLEGAAGSGLTTWAVISGYGSNREIGANAHYTLAMTQDYSLNAVGARFGFFDRIELSLTRQYFDTGEAGAALGLGEGFNFNQDIIGLKIRMFGDAVYAQNSWLPQVAVGVQYKKADKTAIINAIGGKDDDDFDYYFSATKVLLEHSLVLTGTTRLTRANQFGLLGFGGDKSSSHSVQFEGSIAYLLSKNIVLGVDLRTKPDNLGFAKEEDSWATYAVWLPNKNFSVTAAYVDLGDIALHKNQRGFYLSLQMGF